MFWFGSLPLANAFVFQIQISDLEKENIFSLSFWEFCPSSEGSLPRRNEAVCAGCMQKSGTAKYSNIGSDYFH